jgi:copper resistance protein C
MARIIALHPNAAAFIAAAALACIASAPAFAHSFLVDATPSPKDHVSPAPKSVKLRFGGGVEPKYSKLSIEDATGKLFGDGAQEVPGKPKELMLDTPDLPPGRYVVRYRVLSQDGHIVEGNYEFTVDAK